MESIVDLPETVLKEAFQSQLTRWLQLFSVLSISFAVLVPFAGAQHFELVILLPFIHCGIVWLIIIVRSLPTPWASPSMIYIKNNYPQTWRRMHPWGDASHNSFTILAFLAGKYDEGSDSHLQLIKGRMRRLNVLLLWPFALILVCAATGIPLLYIRDMMQRGH